ncbi:MAG: hypothetical protein KDK48_06015, partial [Chlamydiia bacterium]|nr:hypothetical protein [Chlamydiia bacterium]
MMLLSVLCRQSPPPYDPSPNPSDIKSEIEGLFASLNAESDPFKRYQFYLKACDRFQLFCDLRAEGGIHQSQSMLDLARRVEEIGEKSGVATNAGAISSGSYHMPMIANFLAKKLWMYEAGDIQTESLP